MQSIADVLLHNNIVCCSNIFEEIFDTNFVYFSDTELSLSLSLRFNKLNSNTIKMQSFTIVVFVALVFTAAMVTAWPVPESDEKFVPEIINVDDLLDTDKVILLN